MSVTALLSKLQDSDLGLFFAFLWDLILIIFFVIALGYVILRFA